MLEGFYHTYKVVPTLIIVVVRVPKEEENKYFRKEKCCFHNIFTTNHM